MSQNGFLIDVNRCSGCKACSVACKAENNTRPQYKGTAPYRGRVDYRRLVFTAPGTQTAGSATTQARRFISTACYHCTNPACLKVCPGKAISKRATDGVVLIDNNKCLGCKSCQFACPYSAPRFNAIARKMEKCTFCTHRIDNGAAPACVQTCVTKALRWNGLQPNGSTLLATGMPAYTGDGNANIAGVAHAEGPAGNSGGFTGTQTYKRDSATYATLLGTTSTKHGQTLPHVGFCTD